MQALRAIIKRLFTAQRSSLPKLFKELYSKEGAAFILSNYVNKSCNSTSSFDDHDQRSVTLHAIIKKG